MTLTRFDPTPMTGTKFSEFVQTLDSRIAGRLVLNVSGGSDVILTDEQADNGQIIFTGTLTGDIAVVFPDYPFVYHVQNLTTGSYTLTVKTEDGTGIVIQQASLPDHPRIKRVLCDGTDMAWADGSQVVEDNLHETSPTNGYYVRWADGRQECRRAVSVDVSTIGFKNYSCAASFAGAFIGSFSAGDMPFAEGDPQKFANCMLRCRNNQWNFYVSEVFDATTIPVEFIAFGRYQ